MKTTLSVYDFIEAFKRAGRENQFSREGLEIIFNYLEEMNSSYELDVIAICCEFCEATPQQIAKDYQIDLENDGNELNNVRDYLFDETSVLDTTKAGTIVFIQF